MSVACALGACDGAQSALAPAGRAASSISALFDAMTIAFTIVWIAVVALALYAYLSRREHGARTARIVVLVGGVAAPLVVLTGFLIYGLAMMPPLLATGDDAAVKIQVTGHQYWWRVRYIRDGRVAFELANELRLPVGRRAQVVLDSRDVIHSFWVPSLAGKVDMIPGRTTRIVLEPTETGTFRGTCAEYCGTSHAWMSFHAVVEDEPAYERWFAAQERPAVAPSSPAAVAGARQFLANGCGACHTVRGTEARGVIGPDLTHAGSRVSLGAGVLPNGRGALRSWIVATTALKPAVHMPAFGMLPPQAIDELAAYLEGLR